MKKQISLPLIIILFIVVSGCIQSEKTRTPGEIHSQKTIRLQENISDYSATIEEKLQNGGPTIRREILIKRPFMYKINDTQNCYSLSNGTVLWSYCNASDNLRAFSDPSVRDFIADVDYQRIFSSMLGASPATLRGNETIDGTGTWILETTPPRSSAYHMRYDYNSVRLWVDEETGMILRAEMIPKNASDIGIIRFSNISINSGISDEAFMLFPTAGIPVSSQPGQGLYAEGLDKAAGYTSAAKPCTDCPLPTTTPLTESLGGTPATSSAERSHYDYCMIDEVHPDYLHVIPDFISPNATIVHLNAADMKPFPGYEEKMTNETRLSQKWRDGHRSVAVFKDYQRQYSDFQNLTCKKSSDPACNPRQEALYEYNGRYFRVGCYPDFGRERPTRI